MNNELMPCSFESALDELALAFNTLIDNADNKEENRLNVILKVIPVLGLRQDRVPAPKAEDIPTPPNDALDDGKLRMLIAMHLLSNGHKEAAKLVLTFEQKQVIQTVVAHKWNDEGEKCVKCGDSDMWADKSCSESRLQAALSQPVNKMLLDALIAARNRVVYLGMFASENDRICNEQTFLPMFNEAITAASSAPVEFVEGLEEAYETYKYYEDSSTSMRPLVQAARLQLERQKGGV